MNTNNHWRTNLEKLDWLVTMCETYKWDVSDSYRGWLLCAYCTASFGEEGRPFFHRLSRLSPKYEFEENEWQFSQCMKSVKDKENVGLLFKALSEIGVCVRNYFDSKSFSKFNKGYEVR